ncbi:hypothetical protein CY35_15G103800 [Sphagnum magellanicum]|nr:hypothetical protein CY35_15G103800 [Sphagnum magellanicum]
MFCSISPELYGLPMSYCCRCVFYSATRSEIVVLFILRFGDALASQTACRRILQKAALQNLSAWCLYAVAIVEVYAPPMARGYVAKYISLFDSWRANVSLYIITAVQCSPILPTIQ